MSTKTPQPRPMTIRDFARQMGVSKTTVSKAFTGNGRIAPATRDAILAAAQDVGFDLNPHAQRLSVGRSADLVALFTPETLYGGSAGLKSGRIQQILVQQGLDAPLYSSGRLDEGSAPNQVAAIRRLVRQRPRAILCSTLTLPEAAFPPLRRYQAEGGIVVCYDLPVSLESDAVIFDRDVSAYEAARYLLSLGHRQIGLYLVGNRQMGDRFLLPRLSGFQRALAEFGLSLREDWYYEGVAHEAEGARLAEAFLRLAERPTALYMANETVASTFINGILRAGLRVPGDVSVVSHDDLPIAQYAIVPITTVSAPVEEIAQAVSTLLWERLRDPTRPYRRITVRGELIRRESAAAPPGAPRTDQSAALGERLHH